MPVRKILLLILLGLLAGTMSLLRAQQGYRIVVDATINPATSGFIERAIQKSEAGNASCLVIQLNTPGGLLESTRDITGFILEAQVPIIVYVSPAGAHAGSAGVFITLAGHVAAMAPGTNIGAAHPVNMQGGMDTTMSEKVTHDAAAFVRTIAQQRNRNMEWAEEAVRRSVSLTASEALDQNVIDYVASDLGDLLNQADGKEVETPGGVVTLSTSNITLEEIPMSSIEEFLNILSNPNIAYLLLMFGFYGVLFELYNPGAILPGIIGVIGFILGFYSLNTLPLNYAGLALIIFGIILFILEIKITSYGMLSIGGIISLGLGSAMLIRPEMGFQFPGIATSVIVTTTLATAAFFIFVVGMGLRAQRAKPVTNREGFMDETGVTVDVLDPRGNVMIHGELWQAESASGLIPANTNVRVTGRKHFTLFVELLDKT
jgi:membrane-bound serine protease (ClpP class)